MQRAEKAATLLEKDMLAAQKKDRERQQEAEKVLVAKEEEREKRTGEREQKYMDSMTHMMSATSQFLGTMMHGCPSAYMSDASLPVNIPPPASFNNPIQ